MGGEAARQPSSVIGGAASPVKLESYASFAAGVDKGTAADPVIGLVCGKATRAHTAHLITRGTPVGIDGSNTVVIEVYKVSAAGAVVGTIFTKTLTAVPTATSKLGYLVDLGNPVVTYWDIAAGGGIGFSITQGATADIAGGGVVELYVEVGPADDASVVGN